MICMCRFIGDFVQKDGMMKYAGIGHSGGVLCAAFFLLFVKHRELMLDCDALRKVQKVLLVVFILRM